MKTYVKVKDMSTGFLGDGRYHGIKATFITLADVGVACELGESFARIIEVSAEEGDSPEGIANQASTFGNQNVCICGGEPMLQEGCLDLVESLLAAGFTIFLTSHAIIDLEDVDKRVVTIFDLKCPSFGACYQTRWRNIQNRGPQDLIKFVISDRGDYVWARDAIKREKLEDADKIIFAPVKYVLEIDQLAHWLLDDNLNVRLQHNFDLVIHNLS